LVSEVSRKARAAAAGALLGLAAVVGAATAAAEEVSFKDPTGDDNGPGNYTYPTGEVYKPGSFDLTGFTLKARGDKVEVRVSVAARLEDPWRTGSGFSLQTVFIFIQTEAKSEKPAEAKSEKPNAAKSEKPTEAKSEKPAAPKSEKPSTAKAEAKSAAKSAKKAGGGGFTQGLPGLGVQFAPEDAWDRCIILSPLPASRVREEVEAKAAAMKGAIVIPSRVRGSGRTISATLDRKALGAGDPTTWGYQVVMASNDLFPAPGDLLVRKVNERESQHRFGGGTDGDCDPNVVDVLAGGGKGEPGEVEAQHRMLQYECNPDGTPKKLATLKMIHFEEEE
jgi:carbohydrate-binding DOMON domain-containing protein